jgi:prolipoprotein diacylglyceryltransferase
VLELTFVAGLALSFGLLFAWAFKSLPREDWQMLACVPLAKQAAGNWKGLNLTYYGVFLANGCCAALALLLVLLSSVGVPPTATLLLTAIVLAVCLPAARLVARVVERKRYTFTVAGAFFVGALIVPPAIVGLNALLGDTLGARIPWLPALAAISVCYTLGEGLGRLACISFGCCYGKPLSACPPLLRRVFAGRSFVFRGGTKKAVYEGRMEGERLVPVQAVTALLFTALALAGIALFLAGWYAAALISAIAGTQGWRFLSEFLRADDRGGGRISAYQVMAALAVAYCLLLARLAPATTAPATDLAAGLQSLWNPGVLVLLQGMWLVVFLYTGRSQVTESTVSFHVRQERV